MHRGLEATRTRTQSWFMLRIERWFRIVSFHYELDIDEVNLGKAFGGAASELEIQCIDAVRGPLTITTVEMFGVNFL